MSYRIVSAKHIYQVCETGMEAEKLLCAVDFWDVLSQGEEENP